MWASGQVRKRDDEPTAPRTLFNLVDRSHGRPSTAVTSNIDLRERGRYLGDATVAAAVLDRLAMHAIRIDIDGPSYRQHVATVRAGRRPETFTTDGAADIATWTLTQEATLRTRRRATTLVPPPSPTVPDIEAAPELAAIILLEHALDVVGNALLAEHPTLIDDFHRPSEEGPAPLPGEHHLPPCLNPAGPAATLPAGRPTRRLVHPDRRPWRRRALLAELRPPRPDPDAPTARRRRDVCRLRLVAPATSHVTARRVTDPAAPLRQNRRGVGHRSDEVCVDYGEGAAEERRHGCWRGSSVP